jgi:hypothetical protein
MIATSEDGVTNDDFKLKINSFDGCLITSFDTRTFGLFDMYYLVNETAVVQSFREVSDVICRLGTSCCGEREYSLLDTT